MLNQLNVKLIFFHGSPLIFDMHLGHSNYQTALTTTSIEIVMIAKKPN